ncbi:EcsC family protein [Desulfurispira natronophila]|uniref:EcsC family protein n=1 Tax=Desulfurispira natronophila TaxID=682562 RepID=A0A7W7Y3V6_9BACT|nr:EcsC family protein [Desulfurispira natronophila]MBB5021598.1 hypothetical protein [Desulfurispira natronophila]
MSTPVDNPPAIINLRPEDEDALEQALEILECPGLAARLSHQLGVPIEQGFSRLPANWQHRVQQLSEQALRKAIDVAVASLSIEQLQQTTPSEKTHRWLAAGSGGLGGLFGFSALALELPVSTTIMLRSIADIARRQGEEIRNLDTRLACLEVFALGGISSQDEGSGSGYYIVRAALSRAVVDASRYLAQRTITQTGAPPLVQLIAAISTRFGAVVSQKAAAQMVPLVGAAGGAVVNVIFMDHFQNMARGHFVIRRLERAYGKEYIQQRYQQLLTHREDALGQSRQ